MSKRYETIGYILAFLALISFLLGWKLFTGKESPEFKARHEKIVQDTSRNVLAPNQSENPDDSLSIYGVFVVHTPPFKDPFIGYGVYLGQGLVLTASHVIGRIPGYSRPRVVIAGEELRAKVVKQGAPEQIDLALLAIDQSRLPVSLQLRRAPLCRFPFQVGMPVVVAYPDRTVRSQIISPLLIPPQFRSRFSALINEPQGSGSGLFSADKKCLIGIMTAKISKLPAHLEKSPMVSGEAGIFVPVSKGATFLSPVNKF